jgi:VWFA-related protein
MVSRARLFGTLTASLSAATIAATAQQPTPAVQTTPPVFRSGIDLLTTEASAFDKQGHPVADLQADDFTVKVDGKPRKVLFSRFHGAPLAVAGAAATVPGQTSNMTAAPGRAIVIVVDQESIPPGGERVALEAAGRFVDGLSPADAVGLMAIPGIAVDLTRDHAHIRDALVRLIGTQPRSSWEYPMDFDTAERVNRGDKDAIDEAIQACVDDGLPSDSCAVQAASHAAEIVARASSDVRRVLGALGTLVGQLKVIRGPKQIILLSTGMPLGGTTNAEYRAFAQIAAEGEATVYALQLQQIEAEFDAASGPSSPTGSVSRARRSWDGLATLSSATGGAYFWSSGRPTGLFNRIHAELGSFYELGIESGPADANVKVHAIEIRTTKPAVSVRTRPTVVLPARDVKPPTDPLIDVLRQPIDAYELPVAVATYASRAIEDETRTRILVSAEVGGGPALHVPVDWGFVVLSNDRRVADGRHHEASVPGASLDANAYVTLSPGSYRLRFGATDGGGRAGSVEVPLEVPVMSSASEVHTSDLMIGESASGHILPRSRLSRTAHVVAIGELYASTPAIFDKIDVMLQLTAEGATDPIAAQPMELRSGATARVRVARSTMNLASVAPGRYTATAVIRIEGHEAARVSRTVDVVQ